MKKLKIKMNRFSGTRQSESWQNWRLLLYAFILSVTGFSTALPAADELKMNLQQAVDIALAKNPAVKAADWQRQAAQHRVGEARSEYFPQIVASAGYTRYEEPNIVVPIHQVGVFPPLDDEIYAGTLQMKLPLLSGFRTRALVKSASASATEAKITHRQTRIDIINRITTIYVSHAELENNRKILEAHLNSLKRRHQELSYLMAEGRISQANLALVESAMDEIRADSLELQNRERDLSHQLGQILGVNGSVLPSELNFDPQAVDEMGATLANPDSLQSNPRSAGPAVEKAFAKMEQASAGKSAAKRSFIPDLSGFAVYNLRSGADRDPTGEWAAGVTLSIPLFQGGKRISRAKAANASMRAAQQGYLAAQQEEQTRLQLSYNQWQAAQNQQFYLQRAVSNKEKSVEAQRDLYREGRLSLSELLTQENELLQLKIEEQALYFREISALIDYHATAGTLSKQTIQKMIKES